MDGSRYNFAQINYGLERWLITDLCLEAFLLSKSIWRLMALGSSPIFCTGPSRSCRPSGELGTDSRELSQSNLSRRSLGSKGKQWRKESYSALLSTGCYYGATRERLGLPKGLHSLVYRRATWRANKRLRTKDNSQHSHFAYALHPIPFPCVLPRLRFPRRISPTPDPCGARRSVCQHRGLYFCEKQFNAIQITPVAKHLDICHFISPLMFGQRTISTLSSLLREIPSSILQDELSNDTWVHRTQWVYQTD